MDKTSCLNEYGQSVGFALPDWQPVPRPSGVTLEGHFCQLERLEFTHCDALFAAYSQAKDDRDWTWLGADKPSSPEDMYAWVAGKTEDVHLVAYAVIDKIRGQAVGVVCYSCIDTENGALEIGHVTWSVLMKQRVTGTQALYLLLNHAFSLGYRRVAWRCDALNTASRQAAERIGFTFEGRFRQAMTRKQRNRDTDWLSIIDCEWPAISAVLSAWLSEENIDNHGIQKRRLAAFKG